MDFSIETLIETGLLLTKESLANRSASNSGNCSICLSEKFPHGSKNCNSARFWKKLASAPVV